MRIDVVAHPYSPVPGLGKQQTLRHSLLDISQRIEISTKSLKDQGVKELWYDRKAGSSSVWAMIFEECISLDKHVYLVG